MITVRVRDRDIYPIPLWPITTSSVGIPVAFNFDRIWDGLAKIAVFRGSGVDKEVALLTDAAVVPPEVLTTAGGDLYIGVYGRSAYGDLVIPTIWGKAGHIYDGTVPEDPDPADPTPEWSYQVQIAAAEALRIAQALAASAAAGDFDGAPGAVFTPSVSSDGIISWTNSGGLQNPDPVSIKGPPGASGIGVPPGGTTSQVLKKRTDADYDTEWGDGGGGSTSYTVTNSLTHCSSSNSSASAESGSSYSATITPASGYTLTGATVSITMGGSDITSTAYSSGTISIASVTGDIVITITAAAVVPTSYTVSNTLSHCTSSNAATSATEGSSYSATITAASGYTLTGATVAITMGGVDITSSAYSNGTIGIASVTGNIAISVSAVAVPATYTVSNTLSNCSSSNAATTATEGSSYSATITAASGYTLTGATVSITMGGTDITSTAYNNGTVSIASVTGNIAISVTAAAEATLSSISAVFTQGQNVIYNTDSLDTLKQYLVVTATYSDSSTATVAPSAYTLSGTLTAGTSTVTVSYDGKTTTFTVLVTLAPIDLLNVTWANHAITCGQDTNNYNAWSPHNFQYDSVNDCFVFLQCHCNKHLNHTYTNWTLSIINPYDSTDYTAITIPEFLGLGMLYVENGVWTLMPRNQSYAYRSSDMGATWSTLQASIPQYLFGVYKCGETYFAGDDQNSGLKYYTSTDLLTWTQKTFDSSLGYTTLCETTFCDFDGKYWAFNRTNDSTLGHPVILQSTDQGATWTLFSDQMLHGYRSTVSCYPFQNYIMVADIDRDNGILYYTKFDGTTFTELNSWTVPKGGDDFHNVNIASNYDDTVVLEFMHAAPIYFSGGGLYTSDRYCDNVMLVGSTKSLPSLNFDSYIDTAADMLTYANAHLTTGLNGGTYSWVHNAGQNMKIVDSNAITTFIDEIELPLNMMQVISNGNRPVAMFKNADKLVALWNHANGTPGYSITGENTTPTAYIGVVFINNIRYGYGFGRDGELPVLVRLNYTADVTENAKTNYNSVTGETWQENLPFRRVISVNSKSDGSVIAPFLNGLFSATGDHKLAFISYTPVPAAS